jgi:D-arabinose 1-dehydrogenase-like Zn-dependent alcohol dehydrogenase
VLRPGGRIVLYGMTAAQQVPFTMREVLRNQQLVGEFSSSSQHSCYAWFYVQLPGSTMGSKADLQAATDFIAEHRIAPIISRVLDGLENADEGFELLARGDHFGKIVIRMNLDSSRPECGKAKL